MADRVQEYIAFLRGLAGWENVLQFPNGPERALFREDVNHLLGIFDNLLQRGVIQPAAVGNWEDRVDIHDGIPEFNAVVNGNFWVFNDVAIKQEHFGDPDHQEWDDLPALVDANDNVEIKPEGERVTEEQV